MVSGSTAISSYRVGVARCKGLTPELERALSEHHHAGDRSASRRLVEGCLVEGCLGTVLAIAHNYRHCGAPIEDLVQQGNLVELIGDLVALVRDLLDVSADLLASVSSLFCVKRTLSSCWRSLPRHAGPSHASATEFARDTFAPVEPKVGVEARDEMALRGRPLALLADGRGGAFVVSEGAEILASKGALPPGGPRGHVLAAAIAEDAESAPLVGTLSGEVARLRGEVWEVRAHPAAVLALAATRGGVVIGDDVGALGRLDGARIPSLHIDEPVVELRAAGDHLAVLGAEGGLWLTRWPDDEAAPLRRVEAGRVGRAFGLFAARDGSVGVHGARRVGLLDLRRGRVTRASADLGEIRAVAALDPPAGYAVLTDAGQVLLLDEALEHAPAIELGAAAEGVCAAPEGVLLTWTVEGALFHVREARALKIAAEGVVLACALGPSSCLAVHTAPRGVRLATHSWS
jgi:hypothetical protein